MPRLRLARDRFTPEAADCAVASDKKTLTFDTEAECFKALKVLDRRERPAAVIDTQQPAKRDCGCSRANRPEAG